MIKIHLTRKENMNISVFAEKKSSTDMFFK
jgi:hypothetical protein